MCKEGTLKKFKLRHHIMENHNSVAFIVPCVRREPKPDAKYVRMKCDQCEMTFRTTTELDKLKKSHKGSGLIKCVTCDKELKGSKKLKEHEVTIAVRNVRNVLNLIPVCLATEIEE